MIAVKNIPKIGTQKIHVISGGNVSWKELRRCLTWEYNSFHVNSVHLSNKLNQIHYKEFINEGFITLYGVRYINKVLYEFFGKESSVIEQVLALDIEPLSIEESPFNPRKRRKKESVSLASPEFHEYYKGMIESFPSIDKILHSRLDEKNVVIDEIVTILTQNNTDFSKNIFRQHYKLSGRSVAYKAINTTLRLNLTRNYLIWKEFFPELIREFIPEIPELIQVCSFIDLFCLLYEIVYKDFIRLMNNERSVIMIISTFYMVNNKSAARATYLREMKSLCIAMNSLLKVKEITETQLMFFDSTKEWSYKEIGITSKIRTHIKNLQNRKINPKLLFRQLMMAYNRYGYALTNNEIVHQNSLIERKHLESLMKVSFVCELGSKRVGEFKNSNIIYLDSTTKISETTLLINFLDTEESLFSLIKKSPLDGFSTFIILVKEKKIISIVFYWNIAKGHDSTNMTICRVVVHTDKPIIDDEILVLPKRIGIIYEGYVRNYHPIDKFFTSHEQLILNYDGYFPTFQELRTIMSNACQNMSKELFADEGKKKELRKILSHHDPLFAILHQTQMNLERHTINVFDKHYDNQTLSTIEERTFLKLIWKMIEEAT